MAKVKVFFVEDELIHAEAIKIAIDEAGFDCIGECNNADEAYDLIRKANPDVILVDIALPGINNGITLAQQISSELKIPHIFTTSFTQEQVMEQAVSTSPAGYLRKPVDPLNLKAAVKIAVGKGRIEQQQNEKAAKSEDALFTRVGDKLVRVNIDEILMVKADGDNCISLVLENRELSCRATLKEISSQLPDAFIQVHRSYFINLNHLDSYNERQQTAYLKGKNAPVARSFRKAFLNAIRKV
ncbi:MAG: response regulator transcription factor [Prolixibacteraceae bacterium]|nr:response regulator transcription factor [Prolixibacteraceae bacterium]